MQNCYLNQHARHIVLLFTYLYDCYFYIDILLLQTNGQMLIKYVKLFLKHTIFHHLSIGKLADKHSNIVNITEKQVLSKDYIRNIEMAYLSSHLTSFSTEKRSKECIYYHAYLFNHTKSLFSI